MSTRDFDIFGHCIALREIAGEDVRTFTFEAEVTADIGVSEIGNYEYWGRVEHDPGAKYVVGFEIADITVFKEYSEETDDYTIDCLDDEALKAALECHILVDYYDAYIDELTERMSYE